MTNFNGTVRDRGETDEFVVDLITADLFVKSTDDDVVDLAFRFPVVHTVCNSTVTPTVAP